uniref:Non-structural protein 1 n=1 Tax=Ambidensovirus sp. TaxID=2050976 RepID=A0A2P1G6B0_9VIRU|nr:non-structural protein 1 [Ambidensovirus sp.]
MNSVCWEHSWCEHGNVECDCFYCWMEDGQCRSQRVALGKPSANKSRMAANNDEPRNTNFNSTEAIYSTNEKNQRKDNEGANSGNEEDHNANSQLQICSGTTEYANFYTPNSGTRQREEYIFEPNEHFIANHQEETIRRNNDNFRHELFSDEDVDNNGECRSNTESISNTESGRSDQGTSNSPSKDNRDGTDGLVNSTMGITSSCIIAPRSPEQRRSSKTGKRKRESEEHKPRKRKKTKGSDDKQSDSKEEEGTITSGIDELDGNGGIETDSGTGESSYYTFIIHKKNLEDDWRTKAAARTKQAPSFITFDHNEDLHILFSSAATGGNAARVRSRITKYLSAKSAGTQESIITLSRVRLLRRYILYCIRFGIESVNIYGNKTQGKLIEAMNVFKELFENKEDQDIVLDAGCKKYVEESKEEGNKRCGRKKQLHLTEIIMEKIKEHDILTQQQWENKIDPDFKLQLIKEFGLSVDSYIQKIVRIERTTIQQKIKGQTLTEIMMNILQKKYNENDEKFQDVIKWIDYMFKENNIDIIHFLSWNEIIKTKRYKKINGIVLEGITNAGKSLILDNLLAEVRPEEIPRERDNSGFHLDQIPGAGSVLFEEPMITPVNVGTWKLLLEGKRIKTDIKNKDKEPIDRTPTWITTATPITNNVDINETAQILQRIKLYKFEKSIQHRDDKYTKTSQIINKLISRPPALVEPVHIAFKFLKNFTSIYNKIQEEDKSHTINEEAIFFTEELITKATAWQIALQTTTWEKAAENESETPMEEDQEAE